jgi:hypothetical protein
MKGMLSRVGLNELLGAASHKRFYIWQAIITLSTNLERITRASSTPTVLPTMGACYFMFYAIDFAPDISP